jgi:antitoxin (DNA-binding transcriptional repressor) of toxin-antitoxin stability system
MATLAKSLPRTSLSLKPRKVPGRPTISTQKSASVATAKAGLSALIKGVELNREEVILMRRGVPVAKIVPIAESGPQTGYGWMRGSVQEWGDIIGPTGEEWSADNE